MLKVCDQLINLLTLFTSPFTVEMDWFGLGNSSTWFVKLGMDGIGEYSSFKSLSSGPNLNGMETLRGRDPSPNGDVGSVKIDGMLTPFMREEYGAKTGIVDWRLESEEFDSLVGEKDFDGEETVFEDEEETNGGIFPICTWFWRVVIETGFRTIFKLLLNELLLNGLEEIEEEEESWNE